MGTLYRILSAPNSDKIAVLHSVYRLFLSQTILRLIFRKVGSKSVIFRPGLVLGANCIWVGSNSVIRYGSRLEVVKHGQDWTPKLQIGNDVNIEQNVHIVCHDTIIIHDRVSITGNCAIVDVSHPVISGDLRQKIGANIGCSRSHVEIGEGSFLGYGAVVLPNVKIGRQCIIGAGSVVTSDVPDYSIAAGAPARVVGRTQPGNNE